MGNVRRIIRGAAVAMAAIGIAALPSVVSAQEANGPNQGTLSVVVNLTGDPGGDPAAVTFLVRRNTVGGNNDTVIDGRGQVSARTFTVDPGAYLISASTSDPAYVITGTSCISTPPGNGPGTPDFTVTGGGAVTCTITAVYTAPQPTTTTTVPGDTTTTTAPGATTTTVPGDTTTTVPGATTTTIDQVALPATGGTTAGALPAGALPTGALPATGPTGQTTSIALTALGALLLGAGALTVARRH